MYVYIASPYTIGDKKANVMRQINAANQLIDMGHTPYAPLLSHYLHEVKARDYDEWMQQDMRWLHKCDCVLRLPGESEGADREVRLAILCRMRIYYDIADIPASTLHLTKGA